ncbi:phage tail protein [Roseibium sp. M-1]
MTYHLQATFSRGELDPELIYRSDLELFRSSLADCENFITLKRGGLRRRGGTRFVGELKDSSKVGWLIPFEFGNGQSYMLEFGDEYFRVHTSQGRVGTVEVATPYPVEVLKDLKFVQSTDTLFLTGGGFPPQALQRLGEEQWTMEPIAFKDGPFLDVNITPTNLKPTSTGNPVPQMTSNAAPSGTVSASNGSANAWQVFNRSEGRVVLSGGASGWVQYAFPGAVVIDGYMLQAPSDNSLNDDMPWQWNIEASNDGATWTILDTQDGQDTWASNEWRQYEFHNETAFSHYRLSFTQGGGTASDNSAIGQILFHQAGDNQVPFSLTASSKEGINGGEGFKAEDVGRHIRFRGSDGYWRWFKIASITSDIEVKVQVHGQSLPDTKAQSLWRLGAWSGETGWPSTVGWHKNRLAFAGTDEEPQKIWESQTDDFTNFSVSHVLEASDAVTAGILSGQVNRIQWLVDDNDLIVGTSRAVRAVGKATDQDPFGPENVDQRPETNFGTNSISPIKVGSVLLYFGAYGTDMREMAYDFAADGRASQSVSEFQSHLFRTGISGACYQQYPDSILWLWDRTGRCVGFTYERQQQIYGMHRHDFGGAVECLADLSGERSDEVWLIVKRTINGQEKRYIEIMQEPFSGGAAEDAWHLDCACRYTGVAVNTVSGLAYLEGEDVVLHADGSDYRTRVSEGSVRLPNGQTAGKILVGLDVTARARTLPYPVNAQDGAATGRKMKVDSCRIAVLETGTLQAGSDETYLDELIHYRAGDLSGAPAPLRSGVLDRTIDTRWEDGGQLTLEAGGGKPSTILAVNFGRDLEP